MANLVSGQAITGETQPIEISHEEEIGHYKLTLTNLLQLDAEENSLSSVTKESWADAGKCLQSLESYLKETKIRGKQIQNIGIVSTMMLILRSLEALDKLGVDATKVDVKQIEQVWGLVDKLGSGLYYLLDVEKRIPSEDNPPTTRSIFLLVSAPPAVFKISTSRDEWRQKQLNKLQTRLTELVLDPSNPPTADQEQRWSLGFRELEKLESLFTTGVSLQLIKHAKTDASIAAVNKAIEKLFQDIDPLKAEEDHALMLVSWELGMRISEHILKLGT